MRTAIIVNDIDNVSLLRFTETKLFFDAKNNSIDYVSDCVVVSSLEEAETLANKLESSVILYTGDFLTTTFRKNNTNLKVIATGPDVIKFSPETYVGFKQRCHYANGTKQLYIIENLLKTYLRNRNLVYLDNTEDLNFNKIPNRPIRHLYGLASGWKTVQLAAHIGFDNLESITVYDFNLNQLSHAKWLHSNTVLPNTCPTYKNVCGEYNPNTISKEIWEQWNKFSVEFKQINLFDVPQFPDQSLIWVSNVFRYEPNIFDFGWEICKNKHKELFETNKKSIII
jgi:hypothetical protein